MNFRNKLCTVLSLAMIAAAAPAMATSNPAMDQQVKHINDEWARIKYQVRSKDQQYAQLDRLAQEAAQVTGRFPGQAEPLLWQGIVTSEEAAQASVFKQLGLATSARDILVKAYKINPRAENGGVAMSLGVLYYKVPGWPIGFGDTKKAKAYLEQALAVAPDGLDANWFYADYLLSQGNKARARTYLTKALAAPQDPSRPTWDAGRRAEVRAALAKAR